MSEAISFFTINFLIKFALGTRIWQISHLQILLIALKPFLVFDMLYRNTYFVTQYNFYIWIRIEYL